MKKCLVGDVTPGAVVCFKLDIIVTVVLGHQCWSLSALRCIMSHDFLCGVYEELPREFRDVPRRSRLRRGISKSSFKHRLVPSLYGVAPHMIHWRLTMAADSCFSPSHLTETFMWAIECIIYTAARTTLRDMLVSSCFQGYVDKGAPRFSCDTVR